MNKPTETTKERFREMLEVLPPEQMRGGAFLVGEPTDHEGKNNNPRFNMFVNKNNVYWDFGPVSIKEFNLIMDANEKSLIEQINQENRKALLLEQMEAGVLTRII